MDNVNHPGHYQFGQFEAIDIMRSVMTPEQYEGYLRGNCIKYILRYPNKNGAEDLKKAIWYLERLVKAVSE